MSDTPGLDYHFDRMLDDYLEEYFEDRENQWEGLDDDDDEDEQ